MNNIIFGRNAVFETLKNDDRIDKIFIQKDIRFPKEIFALIKSKNISFSYVPKIKLDKHSDNKKHQGVIAFCTDLHIYDFNEVFEDFKVNSNNLFIVVDQILDIGNLGAIIRTTASAEADGIIFAKHNSAIINNDLHKSSAGTVNHVKLIKCGNLIQTLKKLKDFGFWIFGLEASGKKLYFEMDYKIPIVLVLGSESKGISPSILKYLDELIRIPISSKVNSLNVSAAAAIAIFKILENRS